jgi:hypothetical protein
MRVINLAALNEGQGNKKINLILSGANLIQLFRPCLQLAVFVILAHLGADLILMTLGLKHYI